MVTVFKVLLRLLIFRGRSGAAPSSRSGYTTPPEPRRKTTRGDRSADLGEGDATPEPDADA